MATRIVKQAATEKNEKLVLALNAGSSSLKFALFRNVLPLTRMFSGGVDRIGLEKSTFVLKGSDGQKIESGEISAPNHVEAVEHLGQRLRRLTGKSTANIGVDGIGHRVVHGGPRYREPQVVDGAMLVELRRIRAFSPTHLPAEIALMEFFAEKFPA